MVTHSDLITPGRDLWVEMDIPEPVIIRPSWSVQRVGPQLSMTKVPASPLPTIPLDPSLPCTAKVSRTGSGLWTAAPRDPRHMTAEQWLATFVRKADANTSLLGEIDFVALASTDRAAFMRKTLTEALVYTASTWIMASTAQLPAAFCKKPPAGGRWDQELAADARAFPKPPVDDQVAPMDRLLAGRVAYPANTGFTLRFCFGSAPLSGFGCLLNFYFGGPAQVLPREAKGGPMCLSLFGDGRAILWEKERVSTPASSSDWTRIAEFQWAEPGRIANYVPHIITVIPTAQYSLDIISATAEHRQVLGSGGEVMNLAGSVHWRREREAHRTSVDLRRCPVRYTWKAYTTGPGPIRLDIRRDILPVFAISRLTYDTTPGTSVLVDAPVMLPLAGIPKDTPLYCQLIGYEPPGTSLAAAFYHARTGADLSAQEIGYRLYKVPLPKGPVPLQVSVALDTTSEHVSPGLLGFRMWVDGHYKWTNPTPVTFVPTGRVSITGPDLYPDHDSASVVLSDPSNRVTILQRRGRIRSRIWVRWNSPEGLQDTCIFEGETAPVEGVLKGTPGQVWPDPAWKESHIPFVGLWSRLADQLCFCVKDFSGADPTFGERNLKPDPNGDKIHRYPPWKITNMLRWLFRNAGVPDEQLDIPEDVDLRYHVTNSSYDAVITPGQSYIQWIHKLVRDFLGYYLVWDPNAAPHGKWRVLRPPQPNPETGEYTPLFRFVMGPTEPTGAWRLPHAQDAYPANTTWIQRGSYSEFVDPPEANWLLVTGTGQTNIQTAEDAFYTQCAVNPESYDFDPEHPTADLLDPDYLGRWVPETYFDPTLITDRNDKAGSWRKVNMLLYRLANRTFHAEKWCQFVAPLHFIKDPHLGHYRPLRVYDPVLVDGKQALVRSCNPDFESSERMMAHYQCLLISTPLYVG